MASGLIPSAISVGEFAQSLIELRLMRFAGLRHVLKSFYCASENLFKLFSLARHSLGRLHHEQDRKLHGPQDAKHFVILRKRPAVPQLPIVVGTHFGWQCVRDAVDEIRFGKIRRRVHGKSSSLTLSNSANIRRR